MRIFLFFIFIVFSVGCETIEVVKLPQEPAKITVNSFFNGDSVMVVKLSKSASSAHGNNKFEKIENAEVLIFKNDQQVATLPYRGDGNYSLSGFVCSDVGANYTVKANVAGLPTAKASDLLPAKPGVSSFVYTPYTTNDYLYKDFKFSCTLNDGNENNFYLVRVFLKSGSNNNIIDMQLKTSLGQFSTIGSRETLIFNDKAFNGNSVVLDFEVSNLLVSSGPHSIVLEIGNISKTYYDYQFSVKKQLGSDPLFGQEYIPVSSNVSGGLGVFGAYNSQNLSFEVKR